MVVGSDLKARSLAFLPTASIFCCALVKVRTLLGAGEPRAGLRLAAGEWGAYKCTPPDTGENVADRSCRRALLCCCRASECDWPLSGLI